MLLQPMLNRLANARDLAEAQDTALRDFIALHGAEMGDLQLVGADGALVIVSAHGLGREFLETFERVPVVSGSVCARAARSNKPVFVPDVNVDPEFQPYRALAARVPFRAVLSCPLFGKDGKLIGIMSAISWTHFEPTALELDAAQAYCKALSAAIVAFAPAEGLAQWAERKSAAVLKAAGTSSLLPASSSAR